MLSRSRCFVGSLFVFFSILGAKAASADPFQFSTARTDILSQTPSNLYNQGAFAVADFNGDGVPDAVFASTNGDVASQIFLTGTGGKAIPLGSYGLDPYGVLVTGDFNGDGKVDVIDIDQNSGTGQVLLGKGDGTFVAGSALTASKGVTGITTGDFNGDGKLDLATINYYTDGSNQNHASVTIQLGNGDGSFQAPVYAPFGPAYTTGAIAAGDFNGDGRLDLCVSSVDVNGYRDRVTVLLGDGAGGFQNAGDTYFPGDNTYGNHQIAVGDLNGDGKLDVVALDDGVYVNVLYGTGTGAFQPPVTYSIYDAGVPLVGAYDVAISDWNHDGKPDLVLLAGADVTVMLNQGAGAFQPAFSVATGMIFGPARFALGDFNQDGQNDVITFGTNFDRLTSRGMLLSRPDGTLQGARAYPAGYYQPAEMRVGDFNADGLLDLTYGLDGHLLLGHGDGSFTPSLATYTVPATVGDFNGDGIPDRLTHVKTSNFNSTTDQVQIQLGNADGTFQAPVPIFASSNIGDVAASDVNGDGKLDIVVGDFNYSSSAIHIFLGNGDGTFHQVADAGTGDVLKSLTVGDVNGDGKPDLVAVGGSQYAAVSVYLGNGDSSFQAPTLYNLNEYTETDQGQVLIGDFNYDGFTDIAVGTGGSLTLFPGTGAGGFGAPFNIPSDATYLAAGDFNGDGLVDIAGLGRQVTIFQNVRPAVPAVSVTGLAPLSALVNGPSLRMTVTGNGFFSGMAVNWNGSLLATTYVSPTTLSAVIPSADLLTAGTARIQVVAPGSTIASSTVGFSIINPLPSLTGLSSTTAVTGAPAFTLSLYGSHFAPGAVANWNGTPLPTTRSSSTRLSAAVPAAFLQSAYTSAITVSNPGPGGGLSTAQIFHISNPVPVLTSLNPPTTLPGTSFTLTINGKGFMQGGTTPGYNWGGSLVLWNGERLDTHFVSSTQLTADVNYYRDYTAGPVAVTVVNPAPGGGTSNALTFIVDNTAPTTTAAVSGAKVTLTASDPDGAIDVAHTYYTLDGGAQHAYSGGINAPATGSHTVGYWSVDRAGNAETAKSLTFTPLAISSLSPSSAAMGRSDFILTVTGGGYHTGATINWRGAALPTTFVTATKLTAAVSASMVSAAGVIPVTVVDPVSGLTSNPVSFTVSTTTVGMTVVNLFRDQFNNNIVVGVSLANTGYATAPAFTVTAARLAGAATTSQMPQPLGDMAPGGSSMAYFVFPASVGAAGARASLSVNGTYTGGTFANSVTVTLP